MMVHPIVRQVVNRLHVSSPTADVAAAIRGALREDVRTDPARRVFRGQLYRQAVHVHRRNRAQYVEVMYPGRTLAR